MNNQRGIALIFVLLIFAIISTITTKIIVSTRHNILSSTQYLQFQQAKFYALGAEEYLITMLEHRDPDKPRTDTWFANWAEDINLPVNGGNIEIKVIDEQALFNINWLQKEDSEKYYPLFTKLFERLNINPQIIDRLKNRKNDSPEKLAIEDAYYMIMDPPSISGVGPFVSTKELELLPDMDYKSFDKLKPFVTALPPDTALNINTIPAELLAISFDDISDSVVEEIIQSRGINGFPDLQSLQKEQVFIDNKLNMKNIQWSTFSNFFSAYIKVNYGKDIYYLHSLLNINEKGKVNVLSREEGIFPKWISILRQSVRNQ